MNRNGEYLKWDLVNIVLKRVRELSGVILGALIHDDKKKIILDWVSKYPTKITIYQANINNTKYQLDIKKV